MNKYLYLKYFTNIFRGTSIFTWVTCEVSSPVREGEGARSRVRTKRPGDKIKDLAYLSLFIYKQRQANRYESREIQRNMDRDRVGLT